MKLEHLTIDGLGGVTSFECDFHPQFNILCGANGIGKTTILETIGHAFSASTGPLLRRNVNASAGSASMTFEVYAEKRTAQYKITNFDPGVDQGIGGDRLLAENVILITTQRDLTYNRLAAISPDPQPNDVKNRTHHHSNLYVNEIKQWFTNRFIFSHVAKSLSANRKQNQLFSRTIFNKIDEDFAFDSVNAASFEIFVSTPTGTIPFEFLSSGFRSCLVLIWGLIKEIEYRKSEIDILVQEFDGIVLIDELDMHLHPAWQQKIVTILRDCFPKVQFIATTHSPFVIQASNPAEIIALARTPSGGLVRETIGTDDVGFSGWTIEEIAHDVLKVWDTRTPALHQAFAVFQKAIVARNVPEAQGALATLNRLLHPKNITRELLRAQLEDIEADLEAEE